MTAIVLYYLSFPVRGYRWKLLLRNAKIDEGSKDKHLPVLKYGEFIFLSWFVNSITWFRLGDAYRAYAFSDKTKVSFAKTIGTVAAERVIDIAVVFVLLLVSGIGLLRSTDNKTVGVVVVSALALAVTFGLLLLLMRLVGLKVARFLPKRVQELYTTFHEGTLGSFRQLPMVALLSVVIWLLEAGRLFFVTRALGFEIGLAMVLFASLAHSLLTTIPFTPGGLGFVELGLTGLLALAVPKGDAASITLLDRSISYLSIVVFGGLLFAFRQITEARKQSHDKAPVSDSPSETRSP